ncbi:MAG: preprotein translocase subunit YajC [Sedimentisphaerales bacterium]|nr:preprotein translocase subunit YajC [Sedimentisphaerales bacterium]
MQEIWNALLAQAGGGESTEGTPGEGATDTAAETDSGTKQVNPGEKEKVGNKPCAFDNSMLIPLALMFVIIYFLMIRPQKKRQNEQQQMLKQLKKNDRVRTIGGIIGTIVDVREDEVVLKIDETTNAKMRIVRSAIGKVLTEESPPA